MEVILLEQIENLGNIGDKVKVKSGYGRNFLLPQGKATMATAENIAIFEAKRAELEARHAEEKAAAQARADQLEGYVLSITANAGPEGKLFGSLGTIDIADAATADGREIERSEVRLPDGPLRSVGDYDIEIHLHADVNAVIKVNVVGEQDEAQAALLAEIDAEDNPDAAADAGGAGETNTDD